MVQPSIRQDGITISSVLDSHFFRLYIYIYIYIYILERLAEGSLFHRRILWCFVSTHIPIPQRIRCLTVRTDCFYQQHSHQSQLLHSSLMLPSRITIEAGQ